MESEQLDIKPRAPAIFFARIAQAIYFPMIALALVIACIFRAPLSWDGSFYLFEMLDRQSWFIAQPHRWINYPLQLPTLLALHFSANVKLLALIFSFSYASIPLIGLAASYLICRKRPALFVWPAIGIGLVTLPGVFCFHSEATMTTPLFWPVLLASLVGVSPLEFVLVAILALSMLIIHPNAVTLLAAATIAAFISARIQPRNPRRLKGAIALGFLTLVRLIIPLTGYERSQLIGISMAKTFKWGVEGWPLASLALTFIAALLCLRQGLNRKPKGIVDAFGPTLAIVAAGALLVPWALNPSPWGNEMDYRFWMVPLSLLMMGACSLDAWRNADESSMWRQRQPAILASGAMFLIVLSLQSLTWNRITNRLLADLHDGGCLPTSMLPWMRHAPFNHWSVASYAIVLQGRTPHTLVLDGDGCDEYAKDKTVHIIWLHRKSGDGWFDLDQVPSDMHHPWDR